jgi:hypothetical protein
MSDSDHTTPLEIREISDFPGYGVSRDGRVWTRRSANGRGPLKDVWRPLKPEVQHAGHLRVTLQRCDGTHRRMVHRLVLEIFVGPCPEGMECCHFPDRNPANNNLDNLRWDTDSANKQDAIKHGTFPRFFGSESPVAKLDEEDVLMAVRLYREGWRIADLARKFGVKSSTISLILKGKNWGWLTGLAQE